MTHIDVLDSVDSTQDEVIRRLKAGTQAGAVIARMQTAGRGRYGKSWTTIADESLAMSFAWMEAADSPWPPGIALSAGLVAAEAFDTRIAWPNDLMLGDKKVGGVLSEIVSCSFGKVPVIGLGLNLTMTSSPDGIPWASSLLMSGHSVPTPLDAALLFLQGIENETVPVAFAEILARWRMRDATAGKLYELPDGRQAEAAEVMHNGSLKAMVDGVEVVVPSATLIYGNGS